MAQFDPKLAQQITLLRQQIMKQLSQEIVGVQPMNWYYPAGIKKYHDGKVYSKKKYKFSRAKWYQAEFNPKDYDAVDEWCAEQFGPHPKRPDAWSRWWHKFETSILFRDEQDYILFTLRWS